MKWLLALAFLFSSTAFAVGPNTVVSGDVNNPVFAQYEIDGNTTTTSVSNSTQVNVDYNVMEFDTHNAVTTGSSFHFIAPEDGLYFLQAGIDYGASGAWGTGETYDIRIVINGSTEQIDGNTIGGSGEEPQQINATFVTLLSKGDKVEPRTFQTSGGGRSINQGFHFIAAQLR